MTEDQFENLDELHAELWIARRFRQFVSAGFPTELSLIFATHVDIDVPSDSVETAVCEIFGRPAAA